MQYTVSVVALLAYFPLFALGQTPEFCRTYDCPSYTVISTTNEYEVRRYDAATWATSQMSSRGPKAFMRLFRYIRGANRAADGNSMTINMTVPVLKAKSGPTTTIMFYINVANPPTPTDAKVQFWNMPKKDFYVRVFYTDSKASPAKYQEEKVALENALGTTHPYNTTISYTAGYYSPWYQGIRHNEVWMEKL